MIEPNLPKEKSENNRIKRLTALWAFNEAVSGGLLHALHIPLTGIFVGGFAVILIGLILYYSDTKQILLKSFSIVIAVKFIVSPHTPINAYLSVAFQTTVGYLLYRERKSFTLFAYFFAIFTLIFSALQRIFTYTLLFGLTLWESIDTFYSFILNEFGVSGKTIFIESASGVIIFSYLFIHLISGVFIGNILSKLPFIISKNHKTKEFTLIKEELKNLKLEAKKRRKIPRKFTIRLIIIFAFALLVLSFLFPESLKIDENDILLMMFRFILIIVIWYFLLLPLFVKKLNKFTEKTKHAYSEEINEIINNLEKPKYIFFYAWRKSKNLGLFQRIRFFIITLITLFLFEDN